ncbi:MAG: FtsH protease activity modulator HflK [Gammaproteobacteria bacterium]|nr:FtsH protease activity modulator HflK [Gammaproteobacteria bacterium]
MGWNEPGNNDPWSNGGSGNNSGGGRRPNGGQDGPPDLDEALRKLQEQLGAMFGGGGKKSSGGGGASAGFGGILALILLLALGAAAVSSAHIIEPAERGVVTRFGRYVDTLPPGLSFTLPFPIDRVEHVDVDQVRRLGYNGTMLTQDENIVDLKLVVQYKVDDPYRYLFALQDPEKTIDEATASAIREVVGKSKMDFVITDGRSELAENAKFLLQEVLNSYESGVIVVSVNLTDAQAPAAVQDAFEDAIKAREDGERLKNEGEAYANDVIPRARGRAARVLEEANAYRESLVAKAEGESERFTKLLAEYKKAPEVTRERLYLETIESVLGDTSKVMIDTDGNGNALMYLPIDKLMEKSAAGSSNSASNVSSSSSTTTSQPLNQRARYRDGRSREGR